MRYHVELRDNAGNRAASAIAETVGGAVVSNVPRFDGRNDLAVIEFRPQDVDYMDEILDADDNVIRYR